MAEGARIVQLPPLTDGIYRDESPFLIPKGALQSANSVNVGPQGQISRGHAVDTDSDTGAQHTLQQLDQVHVFTENDLDEPWTLGVAANGELEFGTDSFRRTVATGWGAPSSDYRIWYVPAAKMGGYVYATRLDGITPYRIDYPGTGAGDAVTVTATVFDGTSSTFPRANSLAVKDEVMFAGGVRSGVTNIYNRLHWSNVADAETWDAADFIDIGEQEEEGITALAVFGEDLIIFKETSVWVLSGRSPATYTLYQVTNLYGTRAPKSVAQLDDWLVFFDDRNGIVAFDGAGFARLSDGNWQYMMEGRGDNSAAEYLSTKNAGYAIADYYFFSMYWDDNTNTVPSKTFVFHRPTRSWVEWDFGFSDGANSGWLNKGYVCGHNEEDGSVQSGRVLLGTRVDRTWSPRLTSGVKFQTPWLQLAPGGVKARVRRLFLTFTKPDNGTVNIAVRMYVDGESTFKKGQTITLDNATTYGELQHFVLDGYSATKAHTVSWEFEWLAPSASVVGEEFLGGEMTISASGRAVGKDDV